MSDINIISVGGEYGGPDIPKWVRTEQLRLNRLFEKYCKKPYNDAISSIVLALRVEGSMKSFGFIGIDDVSRGPSDTVGADISVTRKDWNSDQAAYRRFLWDLIKRAIEACVERIVQDNLIIDQNRLKQDLEKVEHDFLAGN